MGDAWRAVADAAGRGARAAPRTLDFAAPARVDVVGSHLLCCGAHMGRLSEWPAGLAKVLWVPGLLVGRPDSWLANFRARYATWLAVFQISSWLILCLAECLAC
jgi:hypothetical protein